MTANAIAVAALTKHYGEVLAVDDVTFAIKPNSVCALLGGNGAGKSTTIAMLLGLLLPTDGRIEVLGEDMRRHRYRVLSRINFSSPYVDLPHRLTVAQNLNVFGRLYGVRRLKQRIARLAEELDIARFAQRPYGSLSAGQKTRVALAKALLNEPAVLLLDEPTASLDPDTADRIRGYLLDYRARSGASLLIASHNMPEVERMCDDVIMMRAGRVVNRGTPTALIERFGRNNLEEVFLDIARAGSAGAGMDA